MKDEQKIAQAKRMEELIVYLKTTARICFNIEKALGIVINRQWLINGEGFMLDEKLSTPPPYKSDEDEQPSPMAAEEGEPYGINWKDKYYALLEKYTALLENKA